MQALLGHTYIYICSTSVLNEGREGWLYLEVYIINSIINKALFGYTYEINWQSFGSH